MKRLLFILAMLWSVAYGQSTIYLRGDTIQMVRSGGNAELVLLNATRGVTNGFLKNLGNGRTAFATVPAGDSLFGYKDIIASGQRTFNMNSNNFIYTGNGQFILNNTFTSPNAKLKVVGDNATQHLASFGDSTQDWTFSTSGSFAIRKKHDVTIANAAGHTENTLLVVRQMDIDSGAYLSGFYAGSRFLHEYRIRGQAKLRSEGNDFAMAAVAQLQIRKAVGYSGYSTIGTQSDASIIQAVPALEGLLQMRGSTSSSNGIRATGWWSAVAADLVKTANDTINNVAMFMTMGLNTGKVHRMVDYYAYLSGVSSNDTGYAFFAPFKSQRNLFQNITIGSDEDGEAAGRLNHASAMVDFKSTTKGFLPMVMNTAQRDAISSPASGLHIINSDSSYRWNYYNGSAWASYGSGSGGADGNGIYGGSGSLPSDVTVDGDANDLFFTDMEAFRIYGTGGTYGGVRLFETSGSAGTVMVGRSSAPNTTWSDSVYFSGLGQKIDTTVMKVMTINPNTGAVTYSPWMYAGGGGSSSWNGITDPTGTQTLGFDDGELNAWTVNSNTETFWTTTYNSLTTGTGESHTSSSLTSGNLFHLASTSTALASGNELLNIAMSGANGTSSITATGARISVTNTGTSSENRGIELTASGATTNWAAYATAGNFRTVGAAGYYALNSAATAGVSMIYDNGSIATLGTTGGVRLDLEAASSTILARRPFQIGLGIGYGNSVGLVVYESSTAGSADIANFVTSGGSIRAGVKEDGTIFSGLAGTAVGKLQVSGNTSGTITMQPQAAAGTYNWNYPTTAGSSGQVLTSGGGGSTAMTWSDMTATAYTPTLTDVTNSSGASNAGSSYYYRIGNYIIVYGQLDHTATAGATLTTVDVSLPVASALTAPTDIHGTATAVGGTGMAAGHVRADFTNDRATIFFYSATIGSTNLYYHFMYPVQ